MHAADPAALARVRDAALSRTPISLGVRRTSSPHEFYRYPARFSPALATSVIEALSAPGDLVADYFVGGGTTLVEARRAGRLAVGSDINSLSVFASSVKTRLYSQSDLEQVIDWSGGWTAMARRQSTSRRRMSRLPTSGISPATRWPSSGVSCCRPLRRWMRSIPRRSSRWRAAFY